MEWHTKVLDSRARENRSTTNTHNFTINVDRLGIVPGVTVRVLDVSIPQTSFSVNNTNNKIYFVENSVELTATLTNGNYNTTTILAELDTQMDAVAAETYTWSLDADTQKLTCTQDGASLAFAFQWGTYTTNSAHEVLGFNATDGTASTAAKTADNVYALDLPRGIMVQLDRYQIEAGLQGSGTFTVPWTAPFGDIVTHSFDPEREPTFKILDGARWWNVKLIDFNNNPVDLNNSEWYMRFQVKQP